MGNATALLLLVTCFLAEIAGIMVNGQQKTIDQVLLEANRDILASHDGTVYKDARNNRVITEIDMAFSIRDYERNSLNRVSPSRNKRKAIIDKKWSNGKVYYRLSQDFSDSEKSVIMSAINEYQENSCVRFVEWNGESHYVTIYKDVGCWSYVGRQGGEQHLSLGEGCVYKEVVIHELGHAIGFFHEHSRPDRDEYVEINTENMEERNYQNFYKYRDTKINTYQTMYDYASLMHFGPNAFSKNGQPTITARHSYFQDKMGKREGLSFHDIKLANLMYNCAAANECPERNCGGKKRFQGPDCSCWCCRGNYISGPAARKNC